MQTLGLLFLESLFGNFLFTLCMIFGVKLTSAVYAGVGLAYIPAIVALMSWLFRGERISGPIGGTFALAVAGIGQLALAGPSSQPAATVSPGPRAPATQTVVGGLLLLGAVICKAA